MPQPVYILFGALWTAATSLALGKLLLRGLRIRLYREEETPLAYMAGSALLSLLVFALTAAQVIYKGTVLCLGAAVLLAAWRARVWTPREERLPPLSPRLKWLGSIAAAPFLLLCFTHAMAPEMSPDGSSYHLGLVGRYYRDHGFRLIATNMYAHLSQGVEMLFLYAYAFGRHSGAALVHFSFLVALPWMMLNYARRRGFPKAGAAGALFVLMSPVVGLDAASAYNDVAVAAILFAVFYLVQVWDATRANAVLIPIGLLAGFAYASKYTAFLAVPYAILWIGWRLRKAPRFAMRALATVSICAALMMLPWIVKNTLWTGNPFAPFFNRWFPNPYVEAAFEEDYSRQMRNYEGLRSLADIPLEVTVRGKILGGLIGPFFLLSPLALAALGNSNGRRLLAAALVFGLPYVANIGTRFLIPPLPFLALALALVLERWPRLLALLVVGHALSSWPDMMKLYCDPYAWRLDRIWWKQALRIESEDGFLRRRWPYYEVARMVEELTPPGATVLAFTGASEAYTSRDIIVFFQSARGNKLGDILYTPLIADFQPLRHVMFRFEPRPLRKIRVRQTATGAPDRWSVSELRVFHNGRELPRDPAWRLRAKPNPWDVQDAFDNSPVTRWRTGETIHGGMYLEVDFGREELVDQVTLEMSWDQGKVRVELDGDGRLLSAEPVEREAAPSLGLRRGAAEVVKDLGVRYLLVQEGDLLAPDLAARPGAWGVVQLGDRRGFRLYEIR
jgi:hypothetical protein